MSKPKRSTVPSKRRAENLSRASNKRRRVRADRSRELQKRGYVDGES